MVSLRMGFEMTRKMTTLLKRFFACFDVVHAAGEATGNLGVRREEEMNKSMENAHTLEQLRDVKICASVLKSFFRQLRVNTYPQKCLSII